VISNVTNQDGFKTQEQLDITHIHDKWILSLLNGLILDFENHMDAFQFSEAQQEVYEYFWDQYCDWYLEMSKLRIRSGDVTGIPILVLVLDRILRLLHPFMPFITEEIWQTLKKEIGGSEFNDDALIIAEFPTCQERFTDEESESVMDSVIDIIRAVRNLRAELNIAPNISLEVQIEAESIKYIDQQFVIIEQLANVSIGNNDLTARFEEDDRKQSVSIVLDKSTLTISVKNYINVAAEIDRLTQELEGIDLRVASVEKRLADSKFLTNAPEEIVDKETEKHQTLKERSEKLAKLLAQLK
jgi:valyl-tRNA synthetase